MDTSRFSQIVRHMVDHGTRRGVLRFLASLPLSGALATVWSNSASEAKKKHKKKRHKHKHKHKHKGKATCGAGLILVDGVCERCDVCASGCDFQSIQDAIAAAPGKTIAICPGTYREDLTISQDMRLVGAGDGAGSDGTTVQGTGVNSVVTIGEGVVALQHLRLTGGSGNPAQLDEGGGIYNEGTTALTGCTVTGNSASYGGGIFHAAGALTLTDCTVSGNTADNDGGGIYVIDPESTAELIGCTVSGNTAHSDSGGGIYNQGTLNLTESEISGNEADYGGGIYNYTGEVTADADTRVTGNTAAIDGGGIYNSGTVTLASGANVTGNEPNNCAGTDVELCSG